VLQADGEILVVGDATVFGPGTSDISTTLAMARYNPGGSLDQKFGTSGQLTSPKASDQSTVDQAIGVALQADGRIVVAGFIRTTFSDHDFAVLRLLVNGNLDPSFGIGGSVTIDFGGNDDARSVAVQADGKIVAAGVTVSLTAVTQSGFLQTSFAVARLNSDGSLDPTFGAGGKATTDFGDHVDAPRAVAIQPDGKTVLAGGFGSTIHPPFRGDSFAVARYLPDNVGTPNQRFVEQVYWDLLKRPVDSSGLTTWTRSLDQGLSHAQVAAAIQSSPEYHTLVVGDLYKLVLGRTVDASGSMTWVSFLSQGHPAEQLEAILLSSDEFFVGHGSDNNNGFLPALYQVVLQRPIDSAGSQHWGQALQSGALSRQAVAAAVLASLESDQLEVQNLYMQFLHRATDPGGLDTFTSALQHGLSDEQVALILVGSAEYFARV